MTPALRKLALTAHVAASVGWLGAVAAFLALAVAGLASDDVGTVQAAYRTMDLTAWFVLVPFAVASLVTGVVQSLATTWGLFRHYWVVFKLLLNVFASIVLVLYTETLDRLAADTARADVAAAERASPVLHAAAALLLLLAATALAVYKPRGLTPYGQRRLATRPGRA